MKKRKHAGAAARRENERQAAIEAVADPSKATGAELLRARDVERRAMGEEVRRVRALPAAEREQALPQLQERRDTIVGLESELARRPQLVASPDGKPVRLPPPEGEQSRMRRALDALAVAAGVAKRDASGGTVTLSKEEEMQAHLDRLRRARGADPKSPNVAAAVAAWLVSNEGWPWVAGTAEEPVALEPRDVSTLFLAVGMIAQSGENGSVVVPARSPFRGTRIRADGFLASAEHLAGNRLLTFERRLPEVVIGYGPLLLDIARAAGVTVEGDSAK